MLGNLLLPNAAFKKGCIAPINKLMTVIKTSSSSAHLSYNSRQTHASFLLL